MACTNMNCPSGWGRPTPRQARKRRRSTPRPAPAAPSARDRSENIGGAGANRLHDGQHFDSLLQMRAHGHGDADRAQHHGHQADQAKRPVERFKPSVNAGLVSRKSVICASGRTPAPVRERSMLSPAGNLNRMRSPARLPCCNRPLLASAPSSSSPAGPGPCRNSCGRVRAAKSRRCERSQLPILKRLPPSCAGV